MVRVEKHTTTKQKVFGIGLPFTKINYQILGAGIICIILGYIALAQDPCKNGTMPLVVAPNFVSSGLLSLVIPTGILFRKKTKTEDIVKTAETNSANSH